MKGIWKDEEVKSLFKQVEDVKLSGKPTRQAFDMHAKKYGRQNNSVRNYYYAELSRLEQDEARRELLGIDLKKHQKTGHGTFSEEETNSVIQSIDQKIKEGYSVRKACMILSGGDVKAMLRLQNKYRASTMQKKQNISNNILAFKTRESLISDSDINSLFLGLVKLIKKNAVEQIKSAEAISKKESDQAVRKLMSIVGQKERQLKFLREDYERIKKENALLKKRMLIATCFKASQMGEKKA